MKAEEWEAREESRVLKGRRRRQQEKGEVERAAATMEETDSSVEVRWKYLNHGCSLVVEFSMAMEAQGYNKIIKISKCNFRNFEEMYFSHTVGCIGRC